MRKLGNLERERGGGGRGRRGRERLRVLAGAEAGGGVVAADEGAEGVGVGELGIWRAGRGKTGRHGCVGDFLRKWW